MKRHLLICSDYMLRQTLTNRWGNGWKSQVVFNKAMNLYEFPKDNLKLYHAEMVRNYQKTSGWDTPNLSMYKAINFEKVICRCTMTQDLLIALFLNIYPQMTSAVNLNKTALTPRQSNLACKHEWATYNSGFTMFEYCEKCNERRN